MDLQFYELVEKNDLSGVKRILENNPNININYQNENNHRSTAFHRCCHHGYTDIVELLLKHKGLNVNIADGFYGNTPFSLACKEGRTKTVELLLKDPRVQVDLVDNLKRTPFLLACSFGHKDIAKLLIQDNRVDVNFPDDYGWTPLMHCCKNEKIEAVQELLMYEKINLDVRSLKDRKFANVVYKSGSSVLDVATLKGNKDIIRILEEFDISKEFKKLLQSGSKEEVLKYCLENPQHSLSLSFFGNLIQSGEIEKILNKKEEAFQVNDNTSLFDMKNYVDATWKKKSRAGVSFSQLLIIERGQIQIKNDSELIKQLQFLISKMDCSFSDIKKAYAVYNEYLSSSFYNKAKHIYSEHHTKPDFFNKSDWKKKEEEASELVQKFRFHDHLDQMCKTYPWNSPNKSRVIPLIHGTNNDAVKSICLNNLSAICNTDKGYYGQGIYFTNSIIYAKNYSQPNQDGHHVYILCYVLPGNDYPVTENPFGDDSFRGKSLKPGYQSHYTLVNKFEFDLAFPIEGNIEDNCVCELVVFENAQILPLYVIYI